MVRKDLGFVVLQYIVEADEHDPGKPVRINDILKVSGASLWVIRATLEQLVGAGYIVYEDWAPNEGSYVDLHAFDASHLAKNITLDNFHLPFTLTREGRLHYWALYKSSQELSLTIWQRATFWVVLALTIVQTITALRSCSTE